MRLGGEVEPGPHVSARRRDSGGIAAVQAVARVLHVVLGLLRVLNVPLKICFDLFEKRGADALRYRQLLGPGHPVLLGDHHVGQVFHVGVQLDRHLPRLAVDQDCSIVFNVILYTIIDVGDLGDVKDAGFWQKIFLKLSPTARHQVPGLTVVQHLHTCENGCSQTYHIKIGRAPPCCPSSPDTRSAPAALGSTSSTARSGSRSDGSTWGVPFKMFTDPCDSPHWILDEFERI